MEVQVMHVCLLAMPEMLSAESGHVLGALWRCRPAYYMAVAWLCNAECM